MLPEAVAVVREVPLMVLPLGGIPMSAAPVAMEHRSQPGSLAFPLIWAPIPSAAAAAAAEIRAAALAALAAGAVE